MGVLFSIMETLVVKRYTKKFVKRHNVVLVVVKKRWAHLLYFDIALEVVNYVSFVASSFGSFYKPAG